MRNPNWNASAYTAAYVPPAYLDAINVNIGGDATVIGQQVLKGSHTVQLDTPAQSIIKLAYEQYPSQITFTPGAGDHYVAIDNHAGVFTNENLRKAFWANLDRAAIVKARGGSITSQPMTHFLYPGVQGFDQAGGYAGPQLDFNRKSPATTRGLQVHAAGRVPELPVHGGPRPSRSSAPPTATSRPSPRSSTPRSPAWASRPMSPRSISR